MIGISRHDIERAARATHGVPVGTVLAISYDRRAGRIRIADVDVDADTGWLQRVEVPGVVTLLWIASPVTPEALQASIYQQLALAGIVPRPDGAISVVA